MSKRDKRGYVFLFLQVVSCFSRVQEEKLGTGSNGPIIEDKTTMRQMPNHLRMASGLYCKFQSNLSYRSMWNLLFLNHSH